MDDDGLAAGRGTVDEVEETQIQPVGDTQPTVFSIDYPVLDLRAGRSDHVEEELNAPLHLNHIDCANAPCRVSPTEVIDGFE